jgi:hypothetical protein
MPEDKDLMSQVGESFGIKDDAQQPQSDEGGGDGGQLEPQDLQQQPQQPQDAQQDGGEQPETGSDRHQPRKQDDKEQLFTDKPRKGPRGELLDKAGNIVATTRREKQLAYNLNRAQYAANQASRQLRQMQTHLQHFQAIDNVMKQNNLSPQMAQEALQLRAMAEKDPINAVRDIVARVLSTGVTMEQLFGTDAVPAINASIITNELDRRLGPVEQKARAEQQQAQLDERAQEMMEKFIVDHPHAEVHGSEISGLVSNHGLSPERAYFELRSWVERRGFDFTSPLRPQIEAAMKRQGGGDRGQPTRRVQQPTTPGSMRGVAPNGSVPTHRTDNSRGDFKSNTPWRDIASAVFTELNNK